MNLAHTHTHKQKNKHSQTNTHTLTLTHTQFKTSLIKQEVKMMISCRLGETMEIFLGSECLGRSGSDTTGVCVCVCVYIRLAERALR